LLTFMRLTMMLISKNSLNSLDSKTSNIICKQAKLGESRAFFINILNVR